MVVWAARKPFIDAHRAALVDFLEDTLRITRWYEDPANHQAAMDILGALVKQPPAIFDWAFTKRDGITTRICCRTSAPCRRTSI